MASLESKPPTDLTGPSAADLVENSASSLERTAVELQKALDGEETPLASLINIIRDAPSTSNPTTTSPQEFEKLTEFILFPKLPLETRQYIFRLATPIPEYLEVQIDIAESNDCLKTYGPHDCQEKHGENASFPVITFATPTAPHPLFSACTVSRHELIPITKGVLPAANGAKILFDPVHTTICINNMGNFLSVIEDLGGFGFCCEKFCYRFQGIQKLALDWRCLIDHQYWRDIASMIDSNNSNNSNDSDDSDCSDDEESNDDYDWTHGPAPGTWGDIFEMGFFDLKELVYVVFCRDIYDSATPADFVQFEKEISGAIKKRFFNRNLLGDSGAGEEGQNVGDGALEDGFSEEDDYYDDEDDIDHGLKTRYHSGCLRTLEPKPVRGDTQDGAPYSYAPS